MPPGVSSFVMIVLPYDEENIKSHHANMCILSHTESMDYEQGIRMLSIMVWECCDHLKGLSTKGNHLQVVRCDKG